MTIAFAVALAVLIPQVIFDQNWWAGGVALLLGLVFAGTMRHLLARAVEPLASPASARPASHSLAELHGYAILCHPAQSGLLYALAGSLQEPALLFSSDNAGESWQRVATPGENPYLTGLGIAPTPPHRLSIFSHTHLGGISQTEDLGRHWTSTYGLSSSLNAANAEHEGNLYFSQLVFPPPQLQHLFAVTRHYSGQDRLGVVYSPDGGSTWEPRNSGLPDTSVTALTLDPSQPETLYAAVPPPLSPSNEEDEKDTEHTQLFHSQDAGQTWCPLTTNLPAGSILSLKTSNHAPSSAIMADIYVVIWGKGLYRSNDKGQTWEPLDQYDTLSCPRDIIPHPILGSLLYARGRHVYLSADNGMTWESLTDSLPVKHISDVALDPTDPSVLYLATDVGFFCSTDSGQEWQAINTGLAPKLVAPS